MRKFLPVIALIICVNFVVAQSPVGKPYIKDMKWGLDYQIQLTLFNDSSYTVRVEDIVHSNSVSNDSSLNGFVYYPVMLARDFVDKLKDVRAHDTSAQVKVNALSKPESLWGALHSSLGGGWVHFVNCLLYSLESRYLSITAPLMIRPETSWKPEKPSEKYKRSRKWKYYIPVSQKEAQKEYYLQQKNAELIDLHDVPPAFVDLFLTTDNKDYDKIIAERDYRKQARIDLVKLLLGSGYLGEPQISYIKTMVQKAVVQYSYNQLPTVIVFDDLEAAVVMSLNEVGYNLEQTVFRNASELDVDEKQVRQQKIEQTILAINKVNQKVFEERLKNYFKKAK